MKITSVVGARPNLMKIAPSVRGMRIKHGQGCDHRSGYKCSVGKDPVSHQVDEVMSGDCKKGQVPPLWDGKAAARIVDVITNQVYL